MLKKLFFFLGLVVFGQITSAQGIEFEHSSWDEVLAKAKESDKLIFVDAYAVWCGPCKRMAKTLFPQQEAGDYFNANFINVKMDMEKGDGLTLRKKYPVTAFPTLLFIAPNGDLVHSQKGAPRSVAGLLDIAMQANKKFDRSASFKDKYESGDRSYQTMFGLVKGLNKSNKSSLKYANEYLRSQDDLSTEDNVRFIFEAMTQVDSRIYDHFVDHLPQIKQYFTTEDIKEKITSAANKTIDNAIEFDFVELVDEAQEKYKRILPGDAKNFERSSNRQYASATKNVDLFLANAPKKGAGGDDIKQAINMAIKGFSTNEAILKQSEKWAKQLIQSNGDASAYFLQSQVFIAQNKNAQAKKSLEKCLEMTPDNQKEYRLYKEYLKKLQNSN